MLWVSLLLISCKASDRQPSSEDRTPVHDKRTHDENHFYVAVGAERFEPETLSIPAGKDVILLFDRRPGSPCTGITLDGEDGTPVERAFSGATPLEIHVRLERPGKHRYRCATGTLQGTIVVP